MCQRRSAARFNVPFDKKVSAHRSRFGCDFAQAAEARGIQVIISGLGVKKKGAGGGGELQGAGSRRSGGDGGEVCAGCGRECVGWGGPRHADVDSCRRMPARRAVGTLAIGKVGGDHAGPPDARGGIWRRRRPSWRAAGCIIATSRPQGRQTSLVETHRAARRHDRRCWAAATGRMSRGAKSAVMGYRVNTLPRASTRRPAVRGSRSHAEYDDIDAIARVHTRAWAGVRRTFEFNVSTTRRMRQRRSSRCARAVPLCTSRSSAPAKGVLAIAAIRYAVWPGAVIDELAKVRPDRPPRDVKNRGVRLRCKGQHRIDRSRLLRSGLIGPRKRSCSSSSTSRPKSRSSPAGASMAIRHYGANETFITITSSI